MEVKLEGKPQLRNQGAWQTFGSAAEEDSHHATWPRHWGSLSYHFCETETSKQSPIFNHFESFSDSGQGTMLCFSLTSHGKGCSLSFTKAQTKDMNRVRRQVLNRVLNDGLRCICFDEGIVKPTFPAAQWNGFVIERFAWQIHYHWFMKHLSCLVTASPCRALRLLYPPLRYCVRFVLLGKRDVDAQQHCWHCWVWLELDGTAETDRSSSRNTSESEIETTLGSSRRCLCCCCRRWSWTTGDLGSLLFLWWQW